MVKERSRHTRFNLLSYGASASCFLLNCQDTSAQVIYTDIDPDTVFDAAEEGAYFDIDSNGIFDFAVLNSSFTFTHSITFPYYDVINRQDILAGPYTPENKIAGISEHYFYLGRRYFPYALAADNIIDASLEWHSAEWQLMAIRDYTSGIHTNVCNFCFWYNEELPETTDHYLGLRFLDENNKTHYGWMRCDVLDEGRTLVVKDYAYELQPDVPINAGATVSYHTADTINGFHVNIFSTQSTIYIYFFELPEFPVEVIVYDITGKQIHHTELTGRYSAINVDVPKGIYLVELRTDKASMSEKLYLHK